jgi:GTP cyclohydrolase FolE2
LDHRQRKTYINRANISMHISIFALHLSPIKSKSEWCQKTQITSKTFHFHQCQRTMASPKSKTLCSSSMRLAQWRQSLRQRLIALPSFGSVCSHDLVDAVQDRQALHPLDKDVDRLVSFLETVRVSAVMTLRRTGSVGALSH